MAQVPAINTIIQVAQISQYLYDRAIYSNKFYNNQPLDIRKPELIFLIRKDVEWVYQTNPSDPNLPKTSEYLFGLCSPFTQQALLIINNSTQQPPVISGPANQSVNVGQTATFSVTVTSSLPVIYQWYKNGVLVPGATSASFPLSNAQLSDTGDTFYVVVSNSAGSATSVTATLTVAAALIGYYYQGSTDYSNQLTASVDNVTYLGTFPITTGQPFTVTFPHLVSSEYIVVKYPATEPTKTSYLNPPPSGPDTGTIPSIALDVNSFGGWKYIFSRNGSAFGVNNVNGQIKFN